jgi:hypothetical protein
MPLTFKSVTNPARAGKPMTLVAETIPNVACSLSVHTQEGTAIEVASALRSTNGLGVATWTWGVPASAARQSLTVKVHCVAPGKEASHFETVRVR